MKRVKGWAGGVARGHRNEVREDARMALKRALKKVEGKEYTIRRFDPRNGVRKFKIYSLSNLELTPLEALALVTQTEDFQLAFGGKVKSYFGRYYEGVYYVA
jgi:hypothetical protein